MNESELPVVTGKGGLRGSIVKRGPDQSGDRQAIIRLDDGEYLVVSERVLEPRDDGSYYLPLSRKELEEDLPDAPSAGADTVIDQRVVVPVVEEEMDVRKREVVTGKVRVSKVVREREEVVEEPVFRDEVDVVRVPVERLVEQSEPVRQEGDTMIVSLYEEVLVVEKRLLLKEELHITRRKVEGVASQPVTLRSEEVRIERSSAPPSAGAGPEGPPTQVQR